MAQATDRIYVVGEDGESIELPPGSTDADATGPTGHVLYTDSGGTRRCTCGLYEDEEPK